MVLIEWSYKYRLNKSGISGQTTQQNHSIYAFRNSKYIGLFDIDEYINMQTNNNINIFIDSLIKTHKLNINKLGSFRILNIYNCEEITKNGREKNFVIPKNVRTYSIHAITSGEQMFTIDSKYIYFNHYIFLNKAIRGKDISYLEDKTILKHCIFFHPTLFI